MTQAKQPSPQTRYGLDGLNFFFADVQTGVGPFLAIYLAGNQWNEQSVGIALTVGCIAGILTQTPAGYLADHCRSKRALIAAGVIALAGGSLLIALWPSFWPIMLAQSLIGSASSIFGPCVCAISLGVVGHRMFDRRQGRNQAWNSAGNVTAAIAVGLIEYYLPQRSIFFFLIASTIPTLLALRLIRPEEIDYQQARGAKDGKDDTLAGVAGVFKDKRLIIFMICAILFHFANAAMLPLLGELLSKDHGRSSMMFMSACVVTTQLVITLLASPIGKTAGTWGRKPLLLIGFAVLPLRGVLYTLTDNTLLLVAIQLLDGIAAAIFSVVSVLVTADLTRGTGRFNFTLGVITTAVGIGASLSQFIAGGIVQHFGYNIGFLFLASIAVAAFAILYCFMPETKNTENL